MTVALLTVGLSLWLAGGCSSSKQKWVGEWEGDLQIVGANLPDDDVRATINRVRVTIKPDGTFEMVSSGVPTTGTCRFGDKTTFLRTKTRLGKPIEEYGQGTQGANRDLTLDWQEDGSLLLSDPSAFDPHPVRLDKRPQR